MISKLKLQESQMQTHVHTHRHRLASTIHDMQICQNACKRPIKELLILHSAKCSTQKMCSEEVNLLICWNASKLCVVFAIALSNYSLFKGHWFCSMKSTSLNLSVSFMRQLIVVTVSNNATLLYDTILKVNLDDRHAVRTVESFLLSVVQKRNKAPWIKFKLKQDLYSSPWMHLSSQPTTSTRMLYLSTIVTVEQKMIKLYDAL